METGACCMPVQNSSREIHLNQSWMQDVVIFRFLQGSRTKVLAWAAVFIAVIALVFPSLAPVVFG